MRPARVRFSIATFTLAAAIGVALALPTFAFADGPWIPLPALPWSQPTTGTLVPSGSLAGVSYTINLTQGQTVVAIVTTDPAVKDCVFAFGPASMSSERALFSREVSSTVARVNAMASVAGTYNLVILADTGGDYSLEIATTTPTPFALGSFWVPPTKAKNRRFAVSVCTWPTYNGFTSPIRFQIERRSHGVWRPFSSVASNWVEIGTTRSQFTGRMRLKVGTYRIRAKFSDAAHSSAQYTAFRTIRIR
jgi:hypothetical protein